MIYFWKEYQYVSQDTLWAILSSEFLKIKRKKCHVHKNNKKNLHKWYNDPDFFPYFGRKFWLYRYMLFVPRQKRAEFTILLLRTLFAHLEEKKNCTQHTQYLNQKQIIYMFRKTLIVLYMLTL